jgi:hypothetical protein
MTWIDPTVEELRRWSAELMGYPEGDTLSLGGIMLKQRYDDWTPDLDLNQAFMVVEKMRELGWAVNLTNENSAENLFWTAEFLNGLSAFHSNADSPALAILMAARAAVKG